MKYISALVCIVLAACTAPATPPSLLPRAIETRPDERPTAQPAAPSATIAPSLTAKIERLLMEARAGDAEFVKMQSASVAALAAGRTASNGSDAWIAAELVRSALQVVRQRSASALAETDTLLIDQNELALRDTSVGGLSEIQIALAEMETIVARQTASLDALNR